MSRINVSTINHHFFAPRRRKREKGRRSRGKNIKSYVREKQILTTARAG